MVNDLDGVEAAHLRIAEIVQELYSRPDTDSDTVIAELAEHAAVEIPGAQYAGVTVTRNAKHIDTPAATHKWPILLDEIQQRHREGPCLTAAWEEKTIHVADLETDGRFPLYRRDALEQTPIRSVMAFQMFIAGETMGALNVYAEQPDAFGPAVQGHRLGLRRALVGGVERGAPRRAVQACAGQPRRHRPGQGHDHGAVRRRRGSGVRGVAQAVAGFECAAGPGRRRPCRESAVRDLGVTSRSRRSAGTAGCGTESPCDTD